MVAHLNLVEHAPKCLLLCPCRHDEQAAHLASVTDQFGNTQQALQELQAEFADQSHERTDLQAELASFNTLHAELQALHEVQAAEVQKLNQQLSTVQSSSKDLQVFPSCLTSSTAQSMAVRMTLHKQQLGREPVIMLKMVGCVSLYDIAL